MGPAAAADPESDVLEGAFAQVNLQWFSSLRSTSVTRPQQPLVPKEPGRVAAINMRELPSRYDARSQGLSQGCELVEVWSAATLHQAVGDELSVFAEPVRDFRDGGP